MPFFRFKPTEESPARPPEVSPLVTPSETDADEARRLKGAIGTHVAGLLGEEDPEFVRDLVSTFCGSAHELVARANEARDAQDLAAAGAVAHQLKGSAANVGLADIEAAWHRVEGGAREGDPTVLGLALANAAEMTTRAADLLGRTA